VERFPGAAIWLRLEGADGGRVEDDLSQSEGAMETISGSSSATGTSSEPTPRRQRSIKPRHLDSVWARIAGKEANTMRKTVALIGLAGALILAPMAAEAQTGYGVVPGAPSTSTFDRSWNRANESKNRARAGAEHLRQQRMRAHTHHPANQ
jgi:hypothetical protein